LLRERGDVWWGWWKKDHESAHDELLAELAHALPFSAYLIDTTAETLHLAEVTAVERSIERIDRLGIPVYYRGPGSEKVAAWFRLGSIIAVDYDGDLADQVGTATLYRLVSTDHGQVVVSEPGGLPGTTDNTEIIPSVLLHLSDIHVGADHRFPAVGSGPKVGPTERSLPECIERDVARLGYQGKVGAVIITGDLTSKADWSQRTRVACRDLLVALSERLKVPLKRIWHLPGNHDFERYSADEDPGPDGLQAPDEGITYDHESKYRLFRSEVFGTPVDAPIETLRVMNCGGFEVRIGLLNSCRITATRFTEYGFVGLDRARSILSEVSEHRTGVKSVRIMALHHHYCRWQRLNGLKKTG
jgi:hypothetical protein